mgnify:CR=1 FL=1
MSCTSEVKNDLDTGIIIEELKFDSNISQNIVNYFSKNLRELDDIIDFYNSLLKKQYGLSYGIIKWKTKNPEYRNRQYCNLICFRELLKDKSSYFYYLISASIQFKKWFYTNKVIKSNRIYNKKDNICDFIFKPPIKDNGEIIEYTSK